MMTRNLEPDPELVEQLRRIYGLPEDGARLIAQDPEFAAMARSLIEGRIEREAALERFEEAVRRFHEFLAESAGRR
jgi:hypothetical protein